MAKQTPDRGVGYHKYRAADGCWRPPRPEGLARVLAKAGYGARPRTVEIVQAGRVQIDGKVVSDPGAAVAPASVVLLDEEPLTEAPRRYLVLNKPSGLECQLRGGGSRDLTHMMPVDAVGLEVAGRMDARNSGLLLISNDLRWNRLVAESELLERVFHVLVTGVVTSLVLDVLRAGINIQNQGTLRPRKVKIVRQADGRALVAVALRGDHARKVRAAFASLRCEVETLTLAEVGPVNVDDLSRGSVRDLSPEEQRQLLPPDARGSR